MLNFILTDDLKILLRSGTIYAYSGGIPAGGSLCNALWYKNVNSDVDLTKFKTEIYNLSEIVALPFNHVACPHYSPTIDFKEALLISYLILYIKGEETIPLNNRTLCMRITCNINVKRESFNIVEFLYPNERSSYNEGPGTKIVELSLTGKDLWIH